MRAYYNEIDPYAAQWLGNLIDAGLIAAGDVDERSIVEVLPSELVGYTQHHFFAGLGGWSLALRLAGWPDDKPAWTGSCPCQPFSAAGKRKGAADERHLWPAFFHLIEQCRPPVFFGEQVASKDGRGWLAGVRADLETVGYAVGAADLCAAGIGAPHIRQRLWWVADADRLRSETRGLHGCREAAEKRARRAVAGRCDSGGLADLCGKGLEGRDQGEVGSERAAVERSGGTRDSGLEHATGHRREQWRAESSGWCAAGGCGESFWSDFDIIPCTDGKARRVEPGSFPLAHGIPNRVGRLRAYGNAINPWVAAEFIRAYRGVA